MRGQSKRLALLGLFTAAAILLGYVEMLLPVFTTVPGMKLGLPNLAVVAALYLYGWKDALGVSAVRIGVIALLFGNLFSFLFSLAGGLFSLLVMSLLKRTKWLDEIGVSLAGGVAHNIAQVAVAAVVVDNIRVGYVLIPLCIAGLVTGALIGILSGILIRRLQDIPAK